MNRAISQFRVNLDSAKGLGAIYQGLGAQVTSVVPLDELLRAEIVLAVSAFDCYFHDIVRIRMVAVLGMASGESPAFLNFTVSLCVVKDLLAKSDLADRALVFEKEIRRLHALKTFQRPSAISDALSLIGVGSAWDKVAARIGRPVTDLRTELGLIIDRRNCIAHEGDIDPSAGLALKYPIDYATVERAVSLLDRIASEMHAIIITECV